MLSQIRIINFERADVEPFTLYVDPPEQGFGCIVRSIDGLGPVQSEIRSVSYADLDGAATVNPRVGYRSVTINLGFESNYTLGVTKEDVRRALYKSFLPSEKVRLTLIESEHFYEQTDRKQSLYFDGWVESVESNVWSRDPETTISILSPDPNIYLPRRTIPWISGKEFEIVNEGNHPIGFNLLAQTRYSWLIDIENLTSSEKLTINHAIDPYERLSLSTVEGQKRLEVLSADDSVNRRLWDSYSIEKGWPKIYPGRNRMLITHNHHVDVEGDISYRPAFRGV